MACHIIHLAVTAGRQPCRQPRFLRRKPGVGDADFGEAELESPALNLGGELREIDLRRRCLVHGRTR